MSIHHSLCSLPSVGSVLLPGLKFTKCGRTQIYLLPQNVAVSDEEINMSVHPHELARANLMGSKTRRKEFLRSRYLIHSILGDGGEISSDPSGFIRWPQGWHGSLSHKEDLIALVILPYGACNGIGIDIEEAEKVHLGLAPKIIQEKESDLIVQKTKQYNSWTQENLLALIFSFKESIFKAIYPLGRKFFYFDKFEVSHIDLDRGGIGGKILFDASDITKHGTKIEGDFVVITSEKKRWILTSVMI